MDSSFFFDVDANATISSLTSGCDSQVSKARLFTCCALSGFDGTAADEDPAAVSTARADSASVSTAAADEDPAAVSTARADFASVSTAAADEDPAAVSTASACVGSERLNRSST